METETKGPVRVERGNRHHLPYFVEECWRRRARRIGVTAASSAFCRRHHIARLALFGSVLRDDFGPESDVDVLVEFQAGHVPGMGFVGIEREFSDLLHGRRVDMVTAKFLNPRMREQVVNSAEPLYVGA